MQCYKHPKEETGLSCGKCERPICTKCMVIGPAGVRCKDCAGMKNNPLFKVTPGRLALAIAASALLGLVGPGIYNFTSFIFFIALAYGAFVAEVVLRATGQKRGKTVEAVAFGGIALGAIIDLAPKILVIVATHGANGVDPDIMSYSLTQNVVAIVLAFVGCYYRLRYL